MIKKRWVPTSIQTNPRPVCATGAQRSSPLVADLMPLKSLRLQAGVRTCPVKVTQWCLSGYVLIISGWVLSLVSTQPTLRAPPSTLEWGGATSAYQVEGAIGRGGRGESIWEGFVRQPLRILDGSNADVTANQYDQYLEDVAIMKSLGMQNYRMSISWPRILPTGRLPINPEGLQFYINFLDALNAANIKPHLTLYHWDLPQALESEYGGFRNATAVAQDFADYAGIVVEAFGARAQIYSTFNEPSTFCAFGYGVGVQAPAVLGKYYTCVHAVLTAHAAASKRIRAINPSAKVGIVLFSDWPEPLTNSQQDIDAATRSFDFQTGIYGDAIYFGDYPESVKSRVPAEILPRITPELRKDLLGSVDIWGLNHYTSVWAWYHPVALSLYALTAVDFKTSYVAPNGTMIGAPTGVGWAFVTPFGFPKILKYINDRYRPKEIHVTEQGYATPFESEMPIPMALNDLGRISFYQSYLEGAVEAIQDYGVPLTKYFAWTLLDNWEWNAGFTVRFGIVYVDFPNNQTRYVKDSARWLANYFGTMPPGRAAPVYVAETDSCIPGWRCPAVIAA